MFEIVAEKLENINYSVNYFRSRRDPINRSYDLHSVVDFIYRFVDLNPLKTKIIETTSHLDISGIREDQFLNIVNLTWLNEIKSLDKFFRTVNKKLPFKGLFICRAETEEQRYIRYCKKLPKIFFYPCYCIDFIINRILPKWGLTRRFYLFFTKRENKVLSLAHILGMAVYYGFKINYLKDINNVTHFLFEKIKEPSPNPPPSSGFLFKMKRIGKDGRIIYIYKLRTMHPYSEYIQDFVWNLNGSDNGDKINDDFRVASWGKFLRKYWIDELPMLINLLKGDVKIIGIRPLSAAKFSLYPPDLQLLRTTIKPGLIPPFYIDLPKSFDELLASERKYLLEFKDNPVKTDIKYFYKFIYNIFIRRARSA